MKFSCFGRVEASGECKKKYKRDNELLENEKFRWNLCFFISQFVRNGRRWTNKSVVCRKKNCVPCHASFNSLIKLENCCFLERDHHHQRRGLSCISEWISTSFHHLPKLIHILSLSLSFFCRAYSRNFNFENPSDIHSTERSECCCCCSRRVEFEF